MCLIYLEVNLFWISIKNNFLTFFCTFILSSCKLRPRSIIQGLPLNPNQLQRYIKHSGRDPWPTSCNKELPQINLFLLEHLPDLLVGFEGVVRIQQQFEGQGFGAWDVPGWDARAGFGRQAQETRFRSGVYDFEDLAFLR